MCGGVTFHYDHKELTFYFPNPKAVLPVRLKSGGISLMTWGRRQEEAGSLPQTGWARLESIKAGMWDRFFPKPVKIRVDSFIEKDSLGKSHWFPMSQGHYIQGLVASLDGERRVYVVTITPTLPEQAAVYGRWPRIMFGM